MMTTVEFSLLVRGIPGFAVHHGALGWCSVGLVRAGDRVCLIDTGGFGYRELVIGALGERGISAYEVTDILITHSHWDHVINLDLFPNAAVRMSAEEIEWALSLSENHPLVPVGVVASAMRQGRISALAPGEDAFPGVRSFPTPGHTPGHVSFLVLAEGGAVVFAGDAVKNEVELTTLQAKMTMDSVQSTVSMERIIEVARAAEARICCGHDRQFRWDHGAFKPVSQHSAAIGLIEIQGSDSVAIERLVTLV